MRTKKGDFTCEKKIIKSVGICIESIYVIANRNADEYKYSHGRRNIIHDG